jgi:hypothetical protein
MTAIFTDNTLADAREGMIDNAYPNELRTVIASGALKAGLLCEYASDGGLAPVVKAVAAVPATDANAIADTDIDMAVTETIVDHGDCDGVVGAGLINPCMRLSITLNNHADWDATIGKLVYETDDGSIVSEDLAIPNGGNTILYSSVTAARFIKFIVPAQTSANAKISEIGTVNTIGFVGVDRRHYIGVPVYNAADEPNVATAEYADKDSLTIMTKGRFWAVPEYACAPGMPVFVRMVLSGSDVRGQFTSVATDNFVRLPNATWESTAAADGIAVIELR